MTATVRSFLLDGWSIPANLMSLGRKWAIHVIVVLILLALIVLASAIYRSVDRELTDVALMRRASVANLAAATLSERFARLADIGVSLATRVRFRQLVAQGQWSDAIEILRDVPRDLPVVDRVFLANVEGTLMADAPELAGVRGKNFAHRDWYQKISAGKRPYVSEVYERTATPRLNVFAVAIPIAKEDGRMAGILVLQVHLDSTFFGWSRDIDVGPDGGAYIVDQKGRVAFDSTSPARGELVDLSAMAAVQQLRQGKEGVRIEVDPLSGEETIFSYASAEPYGWGVVTHQSARTSLGLRVRDSQLTRLLGAYALLLLLGGSLSYLTYRVIAQRGQAREHVLVNAELEGRVTERTAQLEAANKELEAFSYSVSHDLRGPLRSMDGFSQVLIEDYHDKLGDEGKDALERIRAASQRMGHLIDDLLRLSHVTRAELNVTRVDLSMLAREIAETLAREDPGRRVEWSIDSGMSVRADRSLMGIALQNLIQNAWKFTGKTERPVIRVGALKRDARTVYFVEDNGAGFDMAHATKLFGAFQRLHHAGDFPGTGIGLAIVRRIMSRHDGEVWAEAKVGEGATFFFDVRELDEETP
jgi:signal transduction histidine kinase